MVRFKAAYVSGAVRQDGVRTSSRRPSGGPGSRIHHLLRPRRVRDEQTAEEEVEAKPAVGDTVLDVLVRRMEGQGPAAHQVWLPPLDEPATLDQLLGPLAPSPRAGTGHPRALNPGHALHALVGVIDKPFEQRREPMLLDLSGSARQRRRGGRTASPARPTSYGR